MTSWWRHDDVIGLFLVTASLPLPSQGAMTDEAAELPQDNHELRPLSKEDIADGLSQLARTVDGLSHAFVRLEVKNKGVTDIEAIRTYKHIRYAIISQNKFESLEPLVDLENLVTLDISTNHITSLELGHSKSCHIAYPDNWRTISSTPECF